MFVQFYENQGRKIKIKECALFCVCMYVCAYVWRSEVNQVSILTFERVPLPGPELTILSRLAS